MARHPIDGVKKSKPRFPKTTPNGRPTSKAEISRLSKDYLEVRNQQMRAKAFMAETQAAERRGELIAKDLVMHQAAYLLVAMRQKILQLPQAYARRLTGLKDVREVKKVLEDAGRSILNEIANLPFAISDPNWIETPEKDADGR
jgi:hypothetical protein